MGLFVSLWTFFSLGNFQESVLSHVYQYAIILLCVVGVVFKSKYRNNDSWHFSFYGMIFWLLLYTTISILNDGPLLHNLEKFLIYGLMIFCCMKIASNYNEVFFIKHVLVGATGILFVSFIFVLAFPSIGIEQDKFFGSWRGVFEQKNALGRVCTISVFCSCYMFFYGSSKIYKKILFFLISIFSIIVCIKTDSRTSVFICVINIAVALYSWSLISIFKRCSITRNLIFLLSHIFLCALIVLLIVFSRTYGIHSGYDGISISGKEISLTGRLTIWYYAVSNTLETHPWFGFGFDNFWTDASFYKFGEMVGMGNFFPNDSHNGLVDLFVQTGSVGVLLYILGLASPLILWKSISSKKMLMFFCMITFYIISNMTESYVTKSTNMLNIMMIIFWMKMFLNETDSLEVKVNE